MIKPIDIKALIVEMIRIFENSLSNGEMGLQPVQGSRKLSKTNSSPTCTINVFTERIMREMGFQHSMKGYYFIKTAIGYCINDMSSLLNLTKRLYPSVASTYRSTGASVERAMRHSIKNAWDKGRLVEFFTSRGGWQADEIERPTIGSLLRYTVDLFRNMENY